jgi:hypothetical protein
MSYETFEYCESNADTDQARKAIREQKQKQMGTYMKEFELRLIF